jgi:glycosyltransferase involved in cell wall biosynthesis
VLRLDVPTVVTLHNYRMLCLPAAFLRDGRICEDCLGKAPWRGVVHRCYRGSATGSAALAVSLTLHRAARSFDAVDRYLAVSDFVREKHIEAGWDPDRIEVKPNFAPRMPRRDLPGEYFLYLGRLSPEKGLDRLVPLWKEIPARLVIVGDGDERARLESSATGDVEFAGEVPPARVPELLARARALVLPSVCYEGAPRTVIEAFAAGVPVVANARGNLPRMVPRDAGVLVDPADPRGWIAAAHELLDDATSLRLGDGAHREWQNRYSPEIAELRLWEAYTGAIGSRNLASGGGSGS